MVRDRIIIEDPITDEEAEKIWQQRLNLVKDAVRKAKRFVKETDLRNKDILFLNALVEVLDGIISKKGG